MSFTTINRDMTSKGFGDTPSSKLFDRQILVEQDGQKNSNNSKQNELDVQLEGETYNQPRKQIKTVPIKIVQNNLVSTQPQDQVRFHKCQLRYKPTFMKNNQNSLKDVEKKQDSELQVLSLEVLQSSAQPQVTVPLVQFQQLLSQVLQNKQTQLSNQNFKNEVTRDKNIYNEIIEQLTQLAQINPGRNKNLNHQPQNDCIQHKFKLFMVVELNNALFSLQNEFILNNLFCKQKLQQLCQSDRILMENFKFWHQNKSPKSFEELKLFCFRDPIKQEEEQNVQIKRIYKNLLVEFYTKHAFTAIMKSNIINKQSCLLLIGEILNRIKYLPNKQTTKQLN